MSDSDSIIPSYEVKRVLLWQNVDHSYVSHGKFHWPFSIAPPSSSVSPQSASFLANPSIGHRSSNDHSTGTGNDPKFQLIITIYRRRHLTRIVGFVIRLYLLP